jgi:hypothetical protein
LCPDPAAFCLSLVEENRVANEYTGKAIGVSKKLGIKEPVNFIRRETKGGDILETRSWLKFLRDVGGVMKYSGLSHEMGG